LVGSDVTNDDDERETANTGASDDAARGKNRFFKNR
jgi:hypothetical protein